MARRDREVRDERWGSAARFGRWFYVGGGITNSAPRRLRHKPLKPLRRESRGKRVFRRTCGSPCAFLRTTAGVMGTWLSLRPLFSRGQRRCITSGATAPRDRDVVSTAGRRSENNDAYRSTGIALLHPPTAVTRVHSCDRTGVPEAGRLLNRSASRRLKSHKFPHILHVLSLPHLRQRASPNYTASAPKLRLIATQVSDQIERIKRRVA